MKLKKIGILLLVAAMVLVLAACGKVNGTWTIQSASGSSGTVTVEQAPELKSIMGDLVLEQDGTGTMTLMGTKYDISWDKEFISADGEHLPYTVKGNTLTLTVFDMEYTYTRK